MSIETETKIELIIYTNKYQNNSVNLKRIVRKSIFAERGMGVAYF